MADTISAKGLTFLGHHFEVTDELAAYISVRKPQEQVAFDIEERYLGVKDKMLTELAQLVRPEEEKYAATVQNDIKTLQQAAEEGMDDLLGRFQASILPEIGQRIIFKYTNNDAITSREINSILFTRPTALYLDVYNGFFSNVYNDIEQVNSLQRGLRERRELSAQRSTPTYQGYGFGFRGTVNAAMGAAATNFGMSLLQGFGDAMTASSDASMVKKQTEKGLSRAKNDLLIMGQEQVKKLAEICLDYLLKEMQAKIDAIGIVPYRTFSQEEQAVIDLRNENYDEAFAEGDIGAERYAAHIFRALNEDPYDKNHYYHLVQAVLVLGDRDAADQILAFTTELGIDRPVKQMLEMESAAKLAQIRDLPESSVEQVEQKLSTVAEVYSSLTISEISRLKEKLELIKKVTKEVPYVQNRIAKYKGLIAAGSMTLFIKPDQTVMALGRNDYGCLDTKHMKNVIAVDAHSNYSIGLCSNGTVILGGNQFYRPSSRKVKDWHDIISVSVGFKHYAALKRDGTVLTCVHTDEEQYDTMHWQNISAISCGSNFICGLKADGTVIIAGKLSDNSDDTQKVVSSVSSWTDVVDISAGGGHVLGLKKDGTVLASCKASFDYGQCKVTDWWGIVAVDAGQTHSVGLRVDGTVVACGSNANGQCNVQDWRDIVAISAGYGYTVGLKTDGTMVAVGDNREGQCNVSRYRLRLE